MGMGKAVRCTEKPFRLERVVGDEDELGNPTVNCKRKNAGSDVSCFRVLRYRVGTAHLSISLV